MRRRLPFPSILASPKCPWQTLKRHAHVSTLPNARSERYAKVKANCASARADYLGLKKTADAEARRDAAK